MFKRYAYHGYRTLTTEEQKSAEQAILWLAKKHINAEHIARLEQKQIDREGKCVIVRTSFKHITIERHIGYEGSPFEAYLTDTLPYLKSRDWVFPNLAWTGVNPSYGFHVHLEPVEKFIQKSRKMVLIKPKACVTIKVSTKKLNIKNQQMVGRRIALRA